MNILTLILVLIAGIILGTIFSLRKKNPKSSKEIKQENSIPEQTIEKENNKEKILEYLKTNSKITNDDVEELVGVSNATAERYLDELEKEDKIEQIGKTGHYTYYQLK